MPFSYAANEITQTGNYLTFTVTVLATTPDAATWSVVGTVSAPQGGATTAAAVGRAVFNTTRAQAASLPNAREIDHSFVTSISSVVAGTATMTGPRYYLADGTEDSFHTRLQVGNVLVIAQNETDLLAAGIANVTAVDSTADYSAAGGVRTDIPWGSAQTKTIRLGTAAQAFTLRVSGAFCVSGNCSIIQGLLGSSTYQTRGSAFTIDVNGYFAFGRYTSTLNGSIVDTEVVYPGIGWTSDTRTATHVSNVSMMVNGYAALYGNLGGQATSFSTFSTGTPTGNRVHFRKCRVWSVGTAVNGVNPNVFNRFGLFTCDELTLFGTIGVQREGSTYQIYSIDNKGTGLSQAGQNAVPAQIVSGYNNTGSQGGIDFRGWQNTISNGTEVSTTQGNMIISYDSPLGTNVYGGSADAAFTANATQYQNLNAEIKRRVQPNFTGANTNAVMYMKDVTRTVTNTSANPRGAVSAAAVGTNQNDCGSTITSRNGSVVATDNIRLSDDRVYTVGNNTTQAVLLGEIYTNDTATANTQSRIGRTGYDGGATGVTTTRVSRRGKDDVQGARNNRDNYDLYNWSYTGAFSKTSDYSMNAGANGSVGSIPVFSAPDFNIVETNPSNVADYTDVGSIDKLYDYAKYYKTATGTVDGRTRQARLELGGVDGSTPSATIANGGGGYLVSRTGPTLTFNDIFTSFTITGGTNTAPFSVSIAAQGPVSGTWNGTSYTYGTAIRGGVAYPTVQGSLTLYAGAANAITGGATLDFGTRDVILDAQATSVGDYAPIRARNITLAGTTVFQDIEATEVIGFATDGDIAEGCSIQVATTITPTGSRQLLFTDCELNLALTLGGDSDVDIDLSGCSGSLTLTRTGTANVRIVLSSGTPRSVLPATLPTWVTQVVGITITKAGGRPFNAVLRHGTPGDYVYIPFVQNQTAITVFISPGRPVEIAAWSLGFKPYRRLLSNTSVALAFDMEMIPADAVDTSIDVSALLSNISLTLDTYLRVVFNASLEIASQETLGALLHRLQGYETWLKAELPPTLDPIIDIRSGEVSINRDAIRFEVGAGVGQSDNLSINAYIATNDITVNPRRVDGKRVELLQSIKPSLDPELLAKYVKQGLSSELARIVAIDGRLPEQPAAVGSAMTLTLEYERAKSAADLASVTALGTPLQSNDYTAPNNTAIASILAAVTTPAQVDLSGLPTLTQIEASLVLAKRSDVNTLLADVQASITESEDSLTASAVANRDTIVANLRIVNDNVQDGSLLIPATRSF